MSGDTILAVDLTRFWAWHHAVPGADVSLFLHPNDHPHDSDLVEIEETGRIVAFHAYPHPAEAWLPNLVNAALYVVRRESPRAWVDSAGPLDFAKDLFPRMLAAGAKLRGYASPEYIKDAGTPERLDDGARTEHWRASTSPQSTCLVLYATRVPRAPSVALPPMSRHVGASSDKVGPPTEQNGSFAAEVGSRFRV